MLYVCNEANHEIWVLRARDLEARTRPLAWATSAFLHAGGGRRASLCEQLGQPKRQHYRYRRPNAACGTLTVGIRPNDMALAPDGRLFVACAGDNTVHVITTAKAGESRARTPVRSAACGRARARSSAPRSIRNPPKAPRPCGGGGLAGWQNALRRQRRPEQRDGGRYFRLAAWRTRPGTRKDLAGQWFHPGGLVSDGGGRFARQPVPAGRQWQGPGFARRAGRREHASAEEGL